MAKKHSRKRRKRIVVHCHCKCPYWGKDHDHIWGCRCECGREEIVCGHCLEAGRVAECSECYKQRLRTGAGDN